MPSTFRIAFLGFSDFERSALGSYFRLANRDPNYAQVQMLTDADFLVADADHVPSMQLVVATDRMAETVFIGSHAPPGAVAWMTRPIDALHVMRELDAMVTLRRARDGDAAGHGVKPAAPQPWGGQLPPAGPMQATASATLATAPAPSYRTASQLPDEQPPLDLQQEDVGQTGSGADATMRGDWNTASLGSSGIPTPFQPWEPSESLLERSASEPLAPPPMSPRMAAAKAAAAEAAREPVVPPAPRLPPPSPPPQAPRALIVDDSTIAQRYLELRLLPWGLHVDRATSSAQARQLMLRHSYDLVFLDVELGPASELDGLALCRQIKQSVAAMSVTVAIVSAHHTELDRVRGALAGCDAYLAKPLDQSELDELLLRQGLRSPTAVRKKYKRAATAP